MGQFSTASTKLYGTLYTVALLSNSTTDNMKQFQSHLRYDTQDIHKTAHNASESALKHYMKVQFIKKIVPTAGARSTA